MYHRIIGLYTLLHNIILTIYDDNSVARYALIFKGVMANLRSRSANSFFLLEWIACEKSQIR